MKNFQFYILYHKQKPHTNKVQGFNISEKIPASAGMTCLCLFSLPLFNQDQQRTGDKQRGISTGGNTYE